MTNQLISKEVAIRAAADAARISGQPAAAYLVVRLDGQHPYYLVHLGRPGGRGAAVMVDARDGSLMAHAAVERIEQPWLMEEQHAVQVAGGAQAVEVRLVWKPSRASRSPFYPLWEISMASGMVWVDQNGRVWRELTPPGPG